MGLWKHVLAVWLVWHSAALAEMPRAVVERTLNATLSLYAAGGDERFLGSAIRFGADGVGLTNAHVVGAADHVIAEARDGTRTRVAVIGRDPGRDLAVLDMPGGVPGLMPVAALPGIGAQVLAVGAPLGLGFTATTGIVAAAPRQVEPAVPLRLVQHDAAINPGSSGGALVDAAGRLVGLNSRIADGSRHYIGIGYAIAGPDLARLVPRLIAGTLAPLPDLGLDARAVTPRIARALGIAATGLLVDDVRAGGVARAAGLRAGDVLLGLDDAHLARPGDLAFALAEAPSGGRLHVLRNGERVELTLVIPRDGTTAEPAAARHPVPYSLADQGVELDAGGAVVAIDPTGPAARAGLIAGDVVTALNGRAGRIASRVLTGPALIRVRRDGVRSLHITFDPADTTRAIRPAGAGNVLDMAVVRF